MVGIEKKCENCGILFLAHTNVSKYCLDCKVQKNNERNRHPDGYWKGYYPVRKAREQAKKES